MFCPGNCSKQQTDCKYRLWQNPPINSIYCWHKSVDRVLNFFSCSFKNLFLCSCQGGTAWFTSHQSFVFTDTFNLFIKVLCTCSVNYPSQYPGAQCSEVAAAIPVHVRPKDFHLLSLSLCSFGNNFSENKNINAILSQSRYKPGWLINSGRNFWWMQKEK